MEIEALGTTAAELGTGQYAERLVYWIGGAPGAGKSRVTRVLAQRHGLWAYYFDWHSSGHQQRRNATIDDFPAIAAWNRRSMDERWVHRSPQQMANDIVAVWAERFPFVVADVEALPPGPCVVEGPGCFPTSVLPVVSDPGRAVWLIPTPDFARCVRESRFKEGDSSAVHTSDPPRALRNITERDTILAAYITEDVQRLGGQMIAIDGSRPIPEIADEIEARFGLTPLSRFAGEYERSDGLRLCIGKADDDLALGPWASPHRDTVQARGHHLFRVAGGHFTGETVRFELDQNGNCVAMLVASERYRRIS